MVNAQQLIDKEGYTPQKQRQILREAQIKMQKSDEKLARKQSIAKKNLDIAKLRAYNEGKKSLQRKLRRGSFSSERGIRRFKSATGGVGQLLSALGANTRGVSTGGSTGSNVRRYAHAGRPSGSYKYGMPIQQFKKLQAQRKALAKLEAIKEQQRMAKAGYTPEQLQQFRLQQMAKEQVDVNMSYQASQMPQTDVIEEYKQELAMQSVSPGTQAILDRVKWIHEKGARDNANMQRVIRERKMVSQATELMKTPSLFGPESNTFNIFDETFNPLKAPNIFKENPVKGNIMKTNRPSITQTAQTGNQLKFF